MKISLKESYPKITKKLSESIDVSNVNALPHITKVSINAGIGPYRAQKDMVKYIEETLNKISGQKPAVTNAKKAISGFKIRTGEHVGFKVTLRGQRMWDFFDRLINIWLPRIRDFKGLDPKHIDKNGNISLGFRDLVPFAELGHQAIDRSFGLEVTIVVTKSDQTKTIKLMELLGFPIKADMQKPTPITAPTPSDNTIEEVIDIEINDQQQDSTDGNP